MKRLGFSIAAMLLSFSVQADGWTGAMRIDQIYVYATSDTILVVTDGAQVYDTVNNCSPHTWSIAANSEPRRQRLYATLLAAQASDKAIQFWWTEGCGQSQSHTTTVMRIRTE